MTRTNMEEALDAVLVPDYWGGEFLRWKRVKGKPVSLGSFSLLPGVCLDEMIALVRSGGWDDVDRFYIDHETMGGG